MVCSLQSPPERCEATWWFSRYFTKLKSGTTDYTFYEQGKAQDIRKYVDDSYPSTLLLQLDQYIETVQHIEIHGQYTDLDAKCV